MDLHKKSRASDSRFLSIFITFILGVSPQVLIVSWGGKSSSTDSSKSACMLKILCQWAFRLAEFSLGSLAIFHSGFWTFLAAGFYDGFGSPLLTWTPYSMLLVLICKCFCHSHFAFLISFLRLHLAFLSFSWDSSEPFFIKFWRAEFLFSISSRRRLSDSVNQSGLWVISCFATLVADIAMCSSNFWKRSGGVLLQGQGFQIRMRPFSIIWGFQRYGG